MEQKHKNRSPADVRLAGDAVVAAVQHAADADAAAALVQKYADKMPDATRGHLVQFAAEAFGLFCDLAAQGFDGWVSEGPIQCPSCEDSMQAEGDEFTCFSCGYKEKR